MKKYIICVAVLLFMVSNVQSQRALVETPPMGWNSFDSYGVYLHEKAALENIDAFAKKLKPFGYEYFVIDAGWFGEFELIEGTIYSKEKHAKSLNINEYGLLQPSHTYFPHGFKKIIRKCHDKGIKFGLHLMRGIPREAVKANLPIQGTSFHAADIADTINVCSWCPQNYGIDMSKPGAQEFYNSLMNQMAKWGVDYIKYDDIVPYPDEVQAVVNAIKQCGRPIVLSLSPGDRVNRNAMDVFKQANLLRVTGDVWDSQRDIDKSFNAWKIWQGVSAPGFWIDLDMIPFGQLQLMAPNPSSQKNEHIRAQVKHGMEQDISFKNALFSGRGRNRWSQLSHRQMQTFIVIRAMAASPLMVGGDLPTMDEYSLSLLTNADIIACNQNGVMGRLCNETQGLSVWRTPSKSGKGGWIGIFNRNNKEKGIQFSLSQAGLNPAEKYDLFDVLHEQEVNDTHFRIPAHGVIFLRYSAVDE